MPVISFHGWRVSKSILVPRYPHADGAVPCLQMNCSSWLFPRCGKWDAMLKGALENGGNSTVKLSITDNGAFYKVLWEPGRVLWFFFHLRVWLREGWKGSVEGALWSVLSCHAQILICVLPSLCPCECPLNADGASFFHENFLGCLLALVVLLLNV